jgi:hypothetical protein
LIDHIGVKNKVVHITSRHIMNTVILLAPQEGGNNKPPYDHEKSHDRPNNCKSIPFFIEYTEGTRDKDTILSQSTSTLARIELVETTRIYGDATTALEKRRTSHDNGTHHKSLPCQNTGVPLVDVYEDTVEEETYNPDSWTGEDSSSRSIEMEAKTGSSPSTPVTSTFEGKRSNSISPTSLTASMLTFSETESHGWLEEEEQEYECSLCCREVEVVSLSDDELSYCGESQSSKESPVSPVIMTDTFKAAEGGYCSADDESLASIDSDNEGATFELADDESYLFSNALFLAPLYTITEEDTLEDTPDDGYNDDEEEEI